MLCFKVMINIVPTIAKHTQRRNRTSNRVYLVFNDNKNLNSLQLRSVTIIIAFDKIFVLHAFQAIYFRNVLLYGQEWCSQQML